jgi:hypothetical protein
MKIIPILIGGKRFNHIIELLSTDEKKAIYKFLLKCRELYPSEGWDYGEKSLNELEKVIRFPSGQLCPYKLDT